MKNIFKLFGTRSRWLCAIALAAIIGFSMIACDTGGGGNEEDGNNWEWSVFNDSSEKGNSKIAMDNVDGVIKIYGTITQDCVGADGGHYGYSGLTAEPKNEKTLENLRKATSITFKIKGDQPFKIQFPQSDITDYSYYMKSLTISSTETEMTIDTAALDKVDWGDAANKEKAFDISKVWILQWMTEIDEGPFSMSIRDLTLQFPKDVAEEEPPMAENPNRGSGREGGTTKIGIPSDLKGLGDAIFELLDQLDKAIAEILSQDGKFCTIKGLKLGTARIKVTAGGKSVIVPFAVTPSAPFLKLPAGDAKKLGDYNTWDIGGGGSRPDELPSDYRNYTAEPTNQLAWYWKNVTNAGGIDFLAYYADPADTGKRGWVRTTFDFGGWRYNLNGSTSQMTNGVQTNGNVKLELIPDFVYDNGVPYLQITHKLTNTGATKLTGQKFGASADIMIYGNDFAPLTYLDYGALMTNQSDSAPPSVKFRFICQNVDGVNNVSTLWMGRFGGERDHVYEDKRTNITGEDSAMNFSYQNIDLDAGQSKTFVVRFTQIQ